MTEPGSREAFEQCRDAIMALDRDDITYCNMPIDQAVAEAVQLSRVVKADREQLIGAGIEPEIVDGFVLRVGALDWAASDYRMAVEKDPEAARRWKEESANGYEMRKYLLKHMSFAFRRNPDLMKQIRHIKEGRGHLDMVSDLLSLSKLGTQNVAYLAQTPMFDRAKLQEAEALHDRLSDLYADATIDPEAINEFKDIYHRAWSYYKQSADEIKEYGQYVFEGTDRYDLYISTYHSETRSNAASNTAQESPEAVSA